MISKKRYTIIYKNRLIQNNSSFQISIHNFNRSTTYLNLFNNMGCGVNSRPRGQKIIMLGLKNSGKTALFHYIVAGQKVHPASTIGINDDSF